MSVDAFLERGPTDANRRGGLWNCEKFCCVFHVFPFSPALPAFLFDVRIANLVSNNRECIFEYYVRSALKLP